RDSGILELSGWKIPIPKVLVIVNSSIPQDVSYFEFARVFCTWGFCISVVQSFIFIQQETP
ncbi:MAG: hypothetical protein C0610_13545, partial [Desulfobacteraceae bacterium]